MTVEIRVGPGVHAMRYRRRPPEPARPVERPPEPVVSPVGYYSKRYLIAWPGGTNTEYDEGSAYRRTWSEPSQFAPFGRARYGHLIHRPRGVNICWSWASRRYQAGKQSADLIGVGGADRRSLEVRVVTADLDAIRARADAATPGPWTHLDRARYFETPPITIDEANWGPEGHHGYSMHTMTDEGAWRYADVEFIAHARTDIPALCDDIEAKDRTLQAVLDLAAPTSPDVFDAGYRHALDDVRRLIEGTEP